MSKESAVAIRRRGAYISAQRAARRERAAINGKATGDGGGMAASLLRHAKNQSSKRQIRRGIGGWRRQNEASENRAAAWRNGSEKTYQAAWQRALWSRQNIGDAAAASLAAWEAWHRGD